MDPGRDSLQPADLVPSLAGLGARAAMGAHWYWDGVGITKTKAGKQTGRANTCHTRSKCKTGPGRNEC